MTSYPDIEKYIEFVKYLILIGANPNQKDKDGNTFLILICSKTKYLAKKYLPVIEYLNSLNVNLHEKNTKGVNAFMNLVFGNAEMEFIDFFVKNGSLLQDTDLQSNTILAYAILGKNSNMIRHLVKNNIELDSKSRSLMIVSNYTILLKLFKIKSLQEYFDEEDYQNIFNISNIQINYEQIQPDELCCICMDDANMTTKCGHYYCQHCYSFFYIIKKNMKICCYCRQDIGNIVNLF